MCFARRKSIKAHLWLNTHTRARVYIYIFHNKNTVVRIHFAWDMSTINLKWNRLYTVCISAHIHTHTQDSRTRLSFFIAFAFVCLLTRSLITTNKSFIINASICDAGEEKKHTNTHSDAAMCAQNAANRIRSKVKRPSSAHNIHLHTLIEIAAITMWACLGIN